MYEARPRPPRARASDASPSATGSTPTCSARERAGLDSALVLTGATERGQADGADARPHPRRRLARGAAADVRRRRHQTHHKHSSTKGYRRLLDKPRGPRGRAPRGHRPRQAAHGRRPPDRRRSRRSAQIESGLSITINTDGAVIDAYVVTSEPDGVAAWLREEGLAQVTPRPVCLIVNPSAGGGRTAQAAARPWRARCAATGSRSGSSARTRSSTPASWRARRSRRGELAAAMGGDGLLGAVAGELRGTDGALGGAARRPRQRLRAQARPRHRPRGGVRRARAGARAGDRRRRRQRPRLPRHRLARASTPTPATSPTRRSCARSSASSSTSTRTLRARARRGGRRAGRSCSTASRARSPATRVAVCNSGVFGGGMYLAPDAELDDGILDVVMIGDIPKRKYLGSLPKVFNGTHVCEPGVELVQAPRGRLPRRPPVQRPGRRRPDRRPPGHRARAARRAAGDGAVSLLAPKVAAAKAVGVLARRAGRGGGTSLPGKLLTRLEPHAIGLLAGRLEHGNVVISATNGKTTTAAMVASILERSGRRLVHNRAGANMAGGVASALADASRRGGRALDGDFGLFEVDEFWLGEVVEELQPAGDAARQPVPRPARPLRRARHDRRPLGGGGRRARGEHPARAQRRRPAGGRPRPGRRGGAVVLRRRGRRRGAQGAPARLRLQALPPLRPRLRLRGRLHGPPRPLPLPQLRQPPPRARGGRRVGPAARHPLGRLHAARARRARPASSCRCPGSTTSTTRSGPPPCACRWASSCRPSPPGSARSSPPSGARRRSSSTAARPRSCWSRTRRAPTRSCARSRSRAASSTSSGCSTTASPTAATSRGCGTPTGRRSPRTSSA